MPDNINGNIFKLPESEYKVSELTDHYASITKGSLRILPKEKTSLCDVRQNTV